MHVDVPPTGKMQIIMHILCQAVLDIVACLACIFSEIDITIGLQRSL